MPESGGRVTLLLAALVFAMLAGCMADAVFACPFEPPAIPASPTSFFKPAEEHAKKIATLSVDTAFQ